MRNLLNSTFILGLISFVVLAVVNSIQIYNKTVAQYAIFGNMAEDMHSARIEQIYVMGTFSVIAAVLVYTLFTQRKK